MEGRRQRDKEKQVSPIDPWDHMCWTAREAGEQPHQLLPIHEASTGRKKPDTCSLFPLFGDPWPSCLLPSYHPMDCSMLGFPVHHCSWSLLKLMSIESMMSSNHFILLSPPSPPALNLSQHQGLFQRVGSSHQVAKVVELQHQSFQWIFRVDFP